MVYPEQYSRVCLKYSGTQVRYVGAINQPPQANDLGMEACDELKAITSYKTLRSRAHHLRMHKTLNLEADIGFGSCQPRRGL